MPKIGERIPLYRYSVSIHEVGAVFALAGTAQITYDGRRQEGVHCVLEHTQKMVERIQIISTNHRNQPKKGGEIMSATYNGRELSIYEEVATHIHDGDVFCKVLLADPDVTMATFNEMLESPAPGSELPRIFNVKNLWDGFRQVEAIEFERHKDELTAHGIGSAEEWSQYLYERWQENDRNNAIKETGSGSTLHR